MNKPKHGWIIPNMFPWSCQVKTEMTPPEKSEILITDNSQSLHHRMLKSRTLILNSFRNVNGPNISSLINSVAGNIILEIQRRRQCLPVKEDRILLNGVARLSALQALSAQQRTMIKGRRRKLLINNLLYNSCWENQYRITHAKLPCPLFRRYSPLLSSHLKPVHQTGSRKRPSGNQSPLLLVSRKVPLLLHRGLHLNERRICQMT